MKTMYDVLKDPDSENWLFEFRRGREEYAQLTREQCFKHTGLMHKQVVFHKQYLDSGIWEVVRGLNDCKYLCRVIVKGKE